MKSHSLILVFLISWIIKGSCSDPLGKVEEDTTHYLRWLKCRRSYLNRDTLCSEVNKNSTSNSSLFTTISFSPNHTRNYQGDESNITVNIEDSNPDPNTTYTYLFCFMRKLNFGNLTTYLASFNTNESSVVESYVWHMVGPVELYVFTWEHETGRNGCDYKRLDVKTCSDSLNISVTCEQDDSYEGPYQVGNLTVTVNVSSSIETQGSDDNGCPQFIDDETHGSSHSGNGSASGESGGGSTNGGGVKEGHDFHYRVCFPIVNGSHRYYYCMEEKSDNDTAQFTYNYQNSVESAAIFIEVFKSSKTKFRYTNDTVNITVDEPVADPQVIYNENDNNKYTKQRITISVSAGGSPPINVSWGVSLDGHESTKQCESNFLILNVANEKKDFYCTFNNSGTYNFNVTFSNTVSQANAAKQIPIQPSPPINVVATSTSVVAVLVVLVIIVIIVIAVVASYMSYRKFHNRATETADFSFVKLKTPPTRRQRLFTQVSKVKDKFGKKKKRFGLVNTDENVDSFYGSLNPFAAHESL